MITTIEDTKLEVLTARIIKGIEYCNTIWQQVRGADDPGQIERLMNLLDSSSTRLHGLITVAQLYGLGGCVFGSCKYSFEEAGFICFGCTK